jgi:hypothetical protein
LRTFNATTGSQSVRLTDLPKQTLANGTRTINLARS